jgi:hypothetical protein
MKCGKFFDQLKIDQLLHELVNTIGEERYVGLIQGSQTFFFPLAKYSFPVGHKGQEATRVTISGN